MAAVAGSLDNNQQHSPLGHDTPDLVQDGGSNEENEDDLFGDDDDDADVQPNKSRRNLDDLDLDSGDDLERADRLADTVEEDGAADEGQGRPVRLVECDVPRLNYPPGTEFYLLNLPDFLGIKHETFDQETYIPPSLAHDGDPTRQTSAYSTAMSSVFWRYDPSEPTPSSAHIQSTSRIIRWSDNSLTLQLATKPTEQYKIATTGLTSTFNKSKQQQHHQPYDPSKDSHTFLAAAHQTPVIDLQLIRALDATMKIHPSGGATDESELRLRQALAVQRDDHDPLARMKDVKEDPEMARKMAEQFEKERMRAQRKRDNAEERMTTKRNNVLGRSGLSSGRAGGAAGLSVAGLEDDEGMPMSRGKKMKSTRKTNRHGEIYSDDEDETLPRGRTREDEYDRNDDFLADSDVEPERYEDDEELLDDEEEDDEEGEEDGGGGEKKKSVPLPGRERERERERERKRERTPKRGRTDELTDADASGEEDTTATAAAPGARQSPQQARKKRRVIEDDEEDDDE